MSSTERRSPDHPSIKVRLDGPLRVSGAVTLYDHEGNVIETPGEDYVLCRCGRSEAAPFCDRSHRQATDGESDVGAEKQHGS